MKNYFLQQIIDAGESGRVEFKANVPALDIIGQTVCAFLNAQGGTLILGIEDNGKVAGIKDATQHIENIKAELINSITPNSSFSAQIESLDNKNIIVIEVPQGMEKPYIHANRIFVRRGSSSTLATGSEINALIEQRSAAQTPWERLPAFGFDIAALDKDEILHTAQEARNNRLTRGLEQDDPVLILERLNLSAGGTICNSALILFGNIPARRYPQIRVRASRLNTNQSTDFIDNRIFEGHLFDLLKQVTGFIQQNIPIRSKMPRLGLIRKDSPAYPMTAIREGLLNALVHRDYARFDGGMSVRITDDQIEIWNSGGLPEGLTIDDLKKGHTSRPHNPDIAYVLFLRGFVEQMGSGTQRIINECHEYGLPEPEWKINSGGISLIIKLKVSKPESGFTFNVRQLELIKKMQEGEQMSPRDYFRSVAEKVQERRARADLVELAEAGYLERIGKGRSIIYARTDKEMM